MKFRSKHIFILKIASIVLLSVSGAWLFVNGLFFSASIFLVAIVIIAISIYYDRKKLFAKVEQLISSIQYEDFSTRFVNRNEKDELHRLSKEMNEALQVFRSKSHDAVKGEAEAKAWQKLISVLTHEIMNSIAPIISLSETLSEQEIHTEPNREDYEIMMQAMETIHRRSKGLLSFVDNYRKLTRLPQPTTYPFYVKTLLQSLQQLLSPAGILFSYELYPEQLVLNADKGMVEQMLINLLKNADEACEAQQEKRISVKAEKLGDDVRITVTDNGQGILPEVSDKVFIPFYSTKSNGSGIGLSICQQIMIRHKGKISLKSNKRGTAFILDFPQ